MGGGEKVTRIWSSMNISRERMRESTNNVENIKIEGLERREQYGSEQRRTKVKRVGKKDKD